MSIETAAVLARVRVLAPEFAAVADATVETLASIMAARITPSVFGLLATDAVAYLVGHELTMQARAAALSAGGAGTGAITSMSTGGISISFGGLAVAATSADAPLPRPHP